MRIPWVRRLVAATSSLAIVLAMPGCTRTVVHRVARYDASSADRIVRSAPESGVYKVRVRAERDDPNYATVPSSERYVAEGQPLGFERAEDCHLYAIANHHRVPIGPSLESSYRITWQLRVEEQTEIGQGVEQAAHVAGTVAVGAGVVTLVGVGIGLGLAAEDDGDDCDDCTGGKICWRHQGR